MSFVTPVMTVTTSSAVDTKKLGCDLGRMLKQGVALALSGDLGSGKTVFVKGLAQGLGVPADHYVVSPTYTLINEYTGRLKLFHADLYRLNTATEIADIGLGEIIDRAEAGVCVVAIEWADRLDNDDLRDHLAVDFEISAESVRTITFRAQGPVPADLLSGLARQNRLQKGEFSAN